jgi:hypothetical protein
MDEKFLTDSLRLDHKPFGTIRSEADNLTNDSITRDFDRREMPIGTYRGGDTIRARCHQQGARGQRAAQKASAIDFSNRGNGACAHRR